MPTYQYACTTCGHQLEAVQSFSDDPLSVCPACEGKLRKLFNSVGIVFKGSGFYRTDSRAGAKDGSGGTAPVPAQKSGDAAPSKDSPSPAKDSKPATTSSSSSSGSSSSGSSSSGSSSTGSSSSGSSSSGSSSSGSSSSSAASAKS